MSQVWGATAVRCASVRECPLSCLGPNGAGRRRCSGSLENNDDVCATVEGSRLATRLDLDLEEALVPGIVARGEEVRSGCGDDATGVSSEQLLEAAPAIHAKDVALVQLAVHVSCLEYVDDSALPSELGDDPGELLQECACRTEQRH